MCVCVCHGWPDYDKFWPLRCASVRGVGSMCVCVCHGWPHYERFGPFCCVQVCEVWGQCVFMCVMGGRIMRGIGHFVQRKCARLGVNVCVCVCVYVMGALL